MSSRLFQGIIHQMRDTIDRVTGVIDENGVIIACSELVKIGEMRQGVRAELAYTTDSVTIGGFTYRPISKISTMRSTIRAPLSRILSWTTFFRLIFT